MDAAAPTCRYRMSAERSRVGLDMGFRCCSPWQSSSGVASRSYDPKMSEKATPKRTAKVCNRSTWLIAGLATRP